MKKRLTDRQYKSLRDFYKSNEWYLLPCGDIQFSWAEDNKVLCNNCCDHYKRDCMPLSWIDYLKFKSKQKGFDFDLLPAHFINEVGIDG